MPKCPVCGTEVQPNTQYCPTCGTNLQQSFGLPPTQTQGYSPQGLPQSGQPHSHRKYVAAIVVALLIGLVVGGVIGFAFPVAVDYTNVSGTVSLSSSYRGSPDLIMFNSTTYGNLTSSVRANHSYLVNLPTGDTYLVSIQWTNATNTQFRCSATPGTFSSNNQNAVQNFSC